MFSAGSGFWKSRPSWILPVSIWASVGVILAITVVCLASNINIVFMHLYYLPFVLIGYYYRKKGIPLIVIISGIYFVLVIFFDYPSVVDIESAGLRTGMFIIIGVIVAILSDSLEKKSADFRR